VNPNRVSNEGSSAAFAAGDIEKKESAIKERK
jgi:hypothetical protein